MKLSLERVKPSRQPSVMKGLHTQVMQTFILFLKSKQTMNTNNGNYHTYKYTRGPFSIMKITYLEGFMLG